MKKQLVIIGILFSFFICEQVHCMKIQFYDNDGFRGLIYESNSTAKCQNLPEAKKEIWIYSIKTDTCAMIYSSSNCRGSSRKFDPNNTHGWNSRVRSFHFCNEDVGGPQLNIDITSYYSGLMEIPVVLESYKHVCKCIDLPQYVQNMSSWSINNYGNDFLAYYEPNCLENKYRRELVPAGHWGWVGDGSMEMHNYKRTCVDGRGWCKLKSIGPVQTSKYFTSSCDVIQIKNHNKVYQNISGGPVVIIAQVANNTQSNQTINYDLQFQTQISELVNTINKLMENNVNISAKLSELSFENEILSKKLVALENNTKTYHARKQLIVNQLQSLDNKVIKLETQFGMHQNLSGKVANLETSLRNLEDMLKNCNPTCTV